MKYRPEIDGLRAVAIIPLVLFHAGIAGFSGGLFLLRGVFVIHGRLTLPARGVVPDPVQELGTGEYLTRVAHKEGQ